MTTQFRTTLQPDSPLVQDAEYRFDGPERQNVDAQIVDMQTILSLLLVNGVTATYITVDTESDDLVKGDVVCKAATTTLKITKATAAAVAAAGTVYGVVLAAAAAGSKALVVLAGALGPDITALATSAAGNVRVDADGRCEKVTEFSIGDYAVGTVDAQGWMTLAISLGVIGDEVALASLEARISTEESTRGSADTSLTVLASTNKSLASAADSSLTVLASVNAATASAASSSLTVLASTNQSLASAADSSLTVADSSLTVLASTNAATASTASSSLTVLASTNKSLASAADSSLTARISQEESRALAADSSLTVIDSTNAATASTASSSLTVLVSTNKSLASAADSSLTVRASLQEAAFAAHENDIVFGANTIGTNTTVRYLFPGYSTGAADTNLVAVLTLAKRTFTSITVWVQSEGVGAENITFTLYRNGSASSLAVTIAATAKSGSATGSVGIDEGETYAIGVSKTGTITSPVVVLVALGSIPG